MNEPILSILKKPVPLHDLAEEGKRLLEVDRVAALPPIPKVDVPKRIRKPVFQDGYLVARNIRRADTGEPVFGKVDSEWVVEEGQKNRKCQLCGLKIAKSDYCVFPGAFGMWKYEEAPLHIDCAAYSLTHCPHILTKRADFGVTLCMDYAVVEFEAPHWRDPGAVPLFTRLSKNKCMGLSFAHDVWPDGNGKYKCRTCPGEHVNQMTWAEFLRWEKLTR